MHFHHPTLADLQTFASPENWEIVWVKGQPNTCKGLQPRVYRQADSHNILAQGLTSCEAMPPAAEMRILTTSEYPPLAALCSAVHPSPVRAVTSARAWISCSTMDVRPGAVHCSFSIDACLALPFSMFVRQRAKSQKGLSDTGRACFRCKATCSTCQNTHKEH